MANSEIPDEIVMDILKRLPVKSLMRFQCVSPAWRVLIKSPFFRNMHIKHRKLLKNNSSSSKSEEEKEEEYILVLSSPRTEDGHAEFSSYTRGHGGELVRKQAPTTLPEFPHRKIELCAPCNGIFCVATKIDDNEFYLCNPATRECRKLPERPFGLHSDKFPRSSVSYVVRTAWGFGVDRRTDELKVVSVMYYGTPGDRYYFDDDTTYDLYDSIVRSCPYVMNHGIIQFEIYDVSSGNWSEVEVVLPEALGLVKRKKNESYVYSMDHWRGGGVFLNGCIHWLYSAYIEEVILSFDISSETMQAFKVPFSPNKGDTLIVLGDTLAMVVQPERVRTSPISIWVMEEYGVETSWVKRYSLFPPYPIPVPLHILHSWKDDDGDLLLFQAADPNRIETLVSCNTSGDGFHTYPIRAMAERYLVLRAIVVSEQTLVSVGPTTSDHNSVSDESTTSDHTLVSDRSTKAGIGGFRLLLQKASAGVPLSGCWGIALVILVNLYAYAVC